MSESPAVNIRPPRWLVKPAAEGAAELAAETGLPPLLTHLLAQRGINTAEKARDFLVPKLATLGDPRLLPEMPAAVDRILRAVDEKQHVVFLLWGAYAQKKGEIIDRNKHLVLMSAHPSPFSADRGFFGCKHFSKANAYLKSKGLKEIEW